MVISQIQDAENNDTISTLLWQAPSIVPKEEFPSLGLEQRKDHKLSELIKYLEDEILPSDSKQCHKLVAQANSFTMINDILYYIDPKHPMLYSNGRR